MGCDLLKGNRGGKLTAERLGVGCSALLGLHPDKDYVSFWKLIMLDVET